MVHELLYNLLNPPYTHIPRHVEHKATKKLLKKARADNNIPLQTQIMMRSLGKKSYGNKSGKYHLHIGLRAGKVRSSPEVNRSSLSGHAR